MSDDLQKLFGETGDENEEEDFLSNLIEPEEEDFFTALRDSSQDDLFTPIEDEEEDILPEEEEDTEWLEDTAAEDLEDSRRPEWVDDLMEGAEFDLEAEQSEPVAPKKPSAIGTFFKTGGFIGSLASDDEVFGLTPQQRMILSIFLFVDIAILGCILLVLTGTIQF